MVKFVKLAVPGVDERAGHTVMLLAAFVCAIKDSQRAERFLDASLPGTTFYAPVGHCPVCAWGLLLLGGQEGSRGAGNRNAHAPTLPGTRVQAA